MKAIDKLSALLVEAERGRDEMRRQRDELRRRLLAVHCLVNRWAPASEPLSRTKIKGK